MKKRLRSAILYNEVDLTVRFEVLRGQLLQKILFNHIRLNCSYSYPNTAIATYTNHFDLNSKAKRSPAMLTALHINVINADSLKIFIIQYTLISFILLKSRIIWKHKHFVVFFQYSFCPISQVISFLAVFILEYIFIHIIVDIFTTKGF